MERICSIEEAKEIFGDNFIGVNELAQCAGMMGGLAFPSDIPPIPYSSDALQKGKDEYLLILGVSKMLDGREVTIMSLRERFGTDPQIMEPCFYNQDWYLKEEFVHKTLAPTWYLIRNKVYADSRAVMPDVLEKRFGFPAAIQCAYAFMTAWICLKQTLWEYDYVWCSDRDHNGDRIYVGRYRDKDAVNKNGFSIHRNLSIRECYAGINVL